uniref:Uncharacterized protein n=1 Tax=Plectus sambesii TaxID=2011161 RepID=A0A914XAW1_9BILA
METRKEEEEWIGGGSLGVIGDDDRWSESRSAPATEVVAKANWRMIVVGALVACSPLSWWYRASRFGACYRAVKVDLHAVRPHALFDEGLDAIVAVLRACGAGLVLGTRRSAGAGAVGLNRPAGRALLR